MANRQDILIFKALKKAYLANRIEIIMNMGILNRYGSPVYNPWHNIIPLVLPCLFGIFVMFKLDIYYGLATIIVGFFVHQIYVKTVVYKLIRNKILDVMFKTLSSFQYIWSLGVITILLRSDSRVGCRSLDGDIKAFVALNLSDMMVDKKVDDSLKMPPPPTSLEDLLKAAELERQEAIRKTQRQETNEQQEIPKIESFEDEFDYEAEAIDPNNR